MTATTAKRRPTKFELVTAATQVNRSNSCAKSPAITSDRAKGTLRTNRERRALRGEKTQKFEFPDKVPPSHHSAEPRQYWRSGQAKKSQSNVWPRADGGVEEDRTPDLRIANAAQCNQPLTRNPLTRPDDVRRRI